MAGQSQRSGLGPQRDILCVISAPYISSLADHDKVDKQTNQFMDKVNKQTSQLILKLLTVGMCL